eukprot:NODE_110_length_18645_cov_0.794403.p1 type:complete len:598 gc:universal NODE_110_length_18645_cov_0.794403:8647-10440(+)
MVMALSGYKITKTLSLHVLIIKSKFFLQMEQFLKFYPHQTKEFLQSIEESKIQEYFEPRIQFGTAGLREICQIGTRYMNGITVVQMAQGLFKWHLSQKGKKQIVVGHDHRHHSLEFATLIANVFHHNGYKIHWLGQCATPLASFASSHFGSLAAMVTASHNPKIYNGVKIYLENGCQLVSPYDKAISKEIDNNLDIEYFDSSPKAYSHIHDEMLQLYFESCKNTARALPEKDCLKAVYTPIHGVGYEMVDKVVKRCFNNVELLVVPTQENPDPDFPTVSFPNPEEQGALDLAMEYAESQNVDIIIANDPDADRLALGQKKDGKWNLFSGDQLGIILGYWLLKNSSGNRAVVSTVVSSHLFSHMAECLRVKAVQCLTGFKWIAAASLELKDQGYKVILAYEEALGYMVGDFPIWDVKDKDGVRAMIVLINLLSHLETQKKSVSSLLDDIYLEFGYFGNSNGYIISNDKQKMEDCIQKLRTSESGLSYQGWKYPEKLGDFVVTRVVDLNVEFDSSKPDFKPILTRQSSPMIQFEFKCESSSQEYKAWLTIRASGTEPKLKYYIEVSSNTDTLSSTIERVDAMACHLEDLVTSEWLAALK